MRFEEMGLQEELLRAVRDLGYVEPTPIQEKAIPKFLEGRDLMCCAQTGTGKTAAFALPMLQMLASRERANLRALILVPTRELAIQVGGNIRECGKYLDLVVATAFGGVPIKPQEMMLRHGVDILIATPGRLIDHMWRGNIDYRHTEFLVLDEADRMLDMGFIKDVQSIVREIPTKRQSMFFSATLEKEVRRLAGGILIDPLRIEVAPPSTTLDEVDQFLVRSSQADKFPMLESLIRQQKMERAIIFARTKVGASKLAGRLRGRSHNASAIHGDRSQSERIQALEGFRSGRIELLVATDIAARGIDVEDVSHVVNYDLPYSAEDYVHRIGRTARAGRRGTAISLVTPEDTRGVQAIERLISMKLSWLDPTGTQEAAKPGRAESQVRHQKKRPSSEFDRSRAPRRPQKSVGRGPNRGRSGKPNPSPARPVEAIPGGIPREPKIGIVRAVFRRLKTGLRSGQW